VIERNAETKRLHYSVLHKGLELTTISGREDGPDFLHCPLHLTPHVFDEFHIRGSWWPINDFDIGLQRQPLKHTRVVPFTVFVKFCGPMSSLGCIRLGYINIWVRTLMVPMHLDLINGPFFPII